MNDSAIRGLIEEFRTDLAALEQRRTALLDGIKALENVLATAAPASANGNAVPTIAPSWVPVPSVVADETQPYQARPGHSATKGTISLRRSIRQVLLDAHGEPLTADEILRRIEAMGARTEAKDPVGVVDFAAYSLKLSGLPLEKVGRRTWRWATERDQPSLVPEEQKAITP